MFWLTFNSLLQAPVKGLCCKSLWEDSKLVYLRLQAAMAMVRGVLPLLAKLETVS